MRIALYEPDIPQNAATIIRLAACLGLPVDILEPAGFHLTDKAFRRAGMDYVEQATVHRHASYGAYRRWLAENGAPRLVLLTTAAATPYLDFAFRTDDVLMMGRESAGVPDEVHGEVDARLLIPMLAGRRSLNVALACAMVTGEALRQTGLAPDPGAVANDPAVG
ncbi:MAG: tRNA (cytidine(34)-2'-O)-methyltransferase [Hyphomicrobiales bacterium]